MRILLQNVNHSQDLQAKYHDALHEYSHLVSVSDPHGMDEPSHVDAK